MVSEDWDGSQGQRALHESKHKGVKVQGVKVSGEQCQGQVAGKDRKEPGVGLKARTWSWTEGLMLI